MPPATSPTMRMRVALIRLAPVKICSISGYAAGTHIAGNTVAIQRLQKTTSTASSARRGLSRRRSNATTLQGSGWCRSARSPASTRFSSYVSYKSPGFDSNDLGFVRRADEKNQSNWFQWHNFKPGSKCARGTSTSTSTGWNWRRPPVFGRQRQLHWTFTNYYSVGVTNRPPFRDRVTRCG